MIKKFLEYINENKVEPKLKIYRNRDSSPYNYTVTNGNKLYLVNIKKGEKIQMVYKGVIDLKIYNPNANLIHKPSNSLLFSIINKIKKIEEEK